MGKILYLVQFYSTGNEPGGQGHRHYKHARALAQAGHEVTVITSGLTTLDMGNPSPKAADEDASPPNLRVVKIPCSPLLKRSVVSRAINYFQFSFKALAAGVDISLREKRSFQYVLGSSPPLLIAMVAYLLSLLNSAQLFLEVRDLWSQTMASNGFIKNRLLIDLNRAVESFLYRRSKKIIILSKAFQQEIEAQVPGSAKKIVFIPNGADLELFDQPRPLRHRQRFFKTSDSKKAFNVVYAGVFSDYTRLETLLDTAELLRDEPEIQIHLAGGGYQFEKLSHMAAERKLENVTFWPTLAKKRVSRFIMEGDLSVICYRDLPIYGKVLPNKLFDYLAAGRPILACVPQGEVSRILNNSGAGQAVPPEAPAQIANAIRWFHKNQELGTHMGRLGQRYVRRHFNRDNLMEGFVALFPAVRPLVPRSRRHAHRSKSIPHHVQRISALPSRMNV